jgi:hypothetical protein
MTDETIRDLLIEIKTRLDVALGQLADHEARVRTVESRPQVDARQQQDNETRLRALERTRWVLFGAAVAGGGLAGKLVGLL